MSSTENDTPALDCGCPTCKIAEAISNTVCDHLPPGADIHHALIALARVGAGILAQGTPRQRLNGVNIIKAELDRCAAIVLQEPESAPTSENTQVH